MTLRRAGLVMLLVAVPAMVAAAVRTPARGVAGPTLQDRERQVSKALARSLQFSDVPHWSSAPRCEDVRPPQALTTPDPILPPVRDRLKVKVSFIIGIDGRVHAPLILQSAGPTGDRHVLQTVRTWRYRPATCNGVPTEAEGKIEFSSR